MRLALLGDPVDHSRSPAIHDAALKELGIAGTYVARRVDRAGLAAAFGEIRSGHLDGANVTMPHKEAAATLVDELSGDAARAGAVNTVWRRDGIVCGALTDVEGVRTAWAWAALPENTSVLVLGGGGAAAAALLALEGRELYVTARRPGSAARLLGRIGVGAGVLPWGEGCDGAVVVNATPLGMAGESLPATALGSAAGLLDMAYGGGVTPAVVAATAAGIPVADGLDMLLGQALASFSLWTGRPAPEAAMRAALA